MKKLLFLVVAMLVVLAGCAEKGKVDKEAKDSDADEKIEITHALGTATFDKAPERVVVLEWNYAEEVLALDIQPVGVADVEGFKKWVKIDKQLGDDVVDVGTRQEPNLEEIAKLNPDVIITLANNHGSIQKDLEKIAPTIFYDTTSKEATKDLYQTAMDSFKTTAKLLQKEQKADEVIQQLEEKYSTVKQEIVSLNLPTKKFLFTQAYTVNQAPTFRLFTKNSMVSHVLEKVGFENTITDHLDADWGFIEANIEGVSNYQDALFMHAVQEDDPLFDNMKNNKVWNDLTFVKDNQLYDIGGDTWTFGGVLSAETLVNNLLKAIKE
ncbi:iron-siderophore ABC transporter substrate-binding protein [Sporosarcina sp. FSL K6-1522]|uniref:ABC transporter substrate-binding protein n=1 Tax=Sporosarcina sp. FSL K6-1522 TaxID=2921554 RepID=UPI00315A9B71